MGCKKILAIVSLLFSLLIAVIIFAVIYKPDFLLNPFKSFLNQPYTAEIPSHSEKRIDPSLFTANPGSLKLDEDEVYNLINDKFPQLRISRVELEENKILVFKNIASKGKPLWAIVELKIENENYKVDKIGFGRFELPDAFKDKFISWFGEKISSVTKGESSETNLSDFIINGLGPLFDPKNVVIHKDEIEVKLMGIESNKYKDLIDSIDPSKYNVGIEETVKEITDSLKTFNSK